MRSHPQVCGGMRSLTFACDGLRSLSIDTPLELTCMFFRFIELERFFSHFALYAS